MVEVATGCWNNQSIIIYKQLVGNIGRGINYVSLQFTIAAQPVREEALDSPHDEGGLAANVWQG